MVLLYAQGTVEGDNPVIHGDGMLWIQLVVPLNEAILTEQDVERENEGRKPT